MVKTKTKTVHVVHSGTITHRRESRREAYIRELTAHMLGRARKRRMEDF